MIRHLRHSLAAFVIVLAGLGYDTLLPRSAAGDVDWRHRFLSDAHDAWRQYELHSAVFQGSISFTRVGAGELQGMVLNRRSEHVKQRPDASILITRVMSKQDADREESASVTLVNPAYASELRRKGADASWFLLGFSLSPVDARDLAFHKRKIEYYTLHPLLIFNREHLIPELLKDKAFKLKGVSRPDRHEHAWIRVSFDYDARGDKAKNIRSGWITLDPQHHWVIREYEVDVEFSDGSKGRQSGAYEYEKGQSTFLIPKRFVWKQNGQLPNGKAVEFETVLDFDFAENPSPSASHFTLSAFGLPEPGGQTDGRPRWYLWTAATAIALLVVAVILRRATRPG